MSLLETHAKVIRTPMEAGDVAQRHEDAINIWLRTREMFGEPIVKIEGLVQSQGEGGITTTIFYKGPSDRTMEENM